MIQLQLYNKKVNRLSDLLYFFELLSFEELRVGRVALTPKEKYVCRYFMCLKGKYIGIIFCA